MRVPARLTVLLLLFGIPVRAPLGAAIELWVAPDGADQNPGTREQPFATIAAAQREARERRRRADPAAKDGVRVILREGRHGLHEPLLLRPEDSGTPESPTIFTSAPGERAVVSGGVVLRGWRLADDDTPGLPAAARGQVWVSDTPRFNGRPLAFRQLWVNGRKAVRARSPNAGTLERLTAWDPRGRTASIPAAILEPIPADTALEMCLHQQWEIAFLRVKDWRSEGGAARLTFHAPESRLEFEHPWPGPIMRSDYRAPFFLTGARELLDAPGEWHQDPAGGPVYYWPRAGEEPERLVAIAPALETLVRFAGSLDRPVAHVRFERITFSHTTWLRPSRAGHVPLQAGMFMLDAYRLRPPGTPDWHKLDNQAWIGRPPGAVSTRAAREIAFTRCRFTHLAAAGLDLGKGTRDARVEGCVFRDIGGNGLQVGWFQEGGVETHLPYDPADEREICARLRIANNVVVDCANEDWGCIGIAAGYVRDTTIEHNDVSQTSYTGISLGWGWTRTLNAMRNNRVHANHVHHVATRMADTAGIYTLSAQPGTIISENAVHDITMGPYAHDPEHWSYLYLDEGSSYMIVRDNWCPEERFQRNANGPGVTWENNGPMVSAEIKAAAGLEPAFRDLAAEIAVAPADHGQDDR